MRAERRGYEEPIYTHPSTIVTTTPCDAPPSPHIFDRLIDHMGSDAMLLFSTDYPHWQFDGDGVLPEGLSRELVRKIMIDNPRETYQRLAQ